MRDKVLGKRRSSRGIQFQLEPRGSHVRLSTVLPNEAAAPIWFEIWGSWTRVKKFRFSSKISEKLRFFQAISQTKNRFSGLISEKFRLFSGNFTKNQVKFPNNFDILGNFPKYFDFLWKFPKKFDFFRQFL